MKNILPNKIRNIAIIGHGGEGKTALTEAMLFSAKAIDRFGKVEEIQPAMIGRIEKAYFHKRHHST